MFAVAIIMIAIVHGTIRYLIRVNQQMSARISDSRPSLATRYF
jgi:hypothetical protein